MIYIYIYHMYIWAVSHVIHNHMQADTTASLAAINNIPCTCRWLFFAKQLNAAVTFPHGPLAELLGGFSLPRTFDCPKDPRSGKFR